MNLKENDKGFTIVELLIVMAVIAAIISALVPIGVNAIRRAKATTIALDLSQISKAVMSDFYLNQNIAPTLQNLKGYFPKSEEQILKQFKLKVVNSTVTNVYVWYAPSDVTASEVERVYPDVIASGTHPMICVAMEKYW